MVSGSTEIQAASQDCCFAHSRYQAVEKSRHEYRENAKRLVAENEALQNAVNQVGTLHTHHNQCPSKLNCHVQCILSLLLIVSMKVSDLEQVKISMH